jgi:hypothetical protein
MAPVHSTGVFLFSRHIRTSPRRHASASRAPSSIVSIICSALIVDVAGDLPAGSVLDETEPVVVEGADGVMSSGTYPTFPAGVTIRTKYDPSCGRGASPAPVGAVPPA